jgi:hypothetical protein
MTTDDSQAVALDQLTLQPSTPAQEFILFTQLPFELRSQVWRSAITSRIVSFTPGGGKPLALFSACWESRNESRPAYDYQLIEAGLVSDTCFALFINHSIDAFNVTGRNHCFPTYGTRTIMRILQCYQPAFMNGLQRLAVSVRIRPWLKEYIFSQADFWETVKAVTPMVTEFVFVFAIDDLMGKGELIAGDELTVRNSTVEEGKTIDVLVASWKEAQDKGICHPLEVRFTRNILI